MESNWYVIQVRTGSEQVICDKIRQRVTAAYWTDCFVPMAEIIHKRAGEYKRLLRPLFPGYLFVISDDITGMADALRQVSDFTRLLKTGETFVALSRDEVDLLNTFAGENHCVSLSTGYIEGDTIVVTDGPLVGYEGLIRKIDRHKRIAEVELSFMERPVLTRMSLEIVSKI